MYSGTTFRHHSGNLIGVHQRIDRVAKKQLIHHIGKQPFFPSIETILRFEGRNGPDGIKTKSPSVDEPWHFIAPTADESDPLVMTIRDHIYNLSIALKKSDEERAGYEAAWLSHAIVDGLTPAHHFPLAEKIEELWGKAHSERDSTIDKILIKGTGKRDMLSKNWEYWGAKGIFSAHLLFEVGIASSIAVAQFKDIGLKQSDFDRIDKEGYVPYFLESVSAIDALGTFQEFSKNGWSVYLGRITRTKMMPIIMRNVVLAWYAAHEGKTL